MTDNDDIMRHLPTVLAVIARSAGLDAAVRIAQEWGGTKRYLPGGRRGFLRETDHDRSALVRLVGVEAAAKIAETSLGGDYVDIPAMPSGLSKKLAILRHSGRTREVARAVGCTERYVRMVRAMK